MSLATRQQVSFKAPNSLAFGPFCLKLQTDGEMVLSGKPEVGFLHRGIEKISERMIWTSFLPYTDRIDYLAAVHGNYAYALAVEMLAGVEVSERAQAIRTVVCELNRIASHLLNIGIIAQQLGSGTGFMYALRDREKVNDLFEMLCGARLTYSYIRVGGVSADVTAGFIERTYDFINYLLPRLKEYDSLLTDNEIFIGRLANIGVLDLNFAVANGITGPNLRASGMKYDLRKHAPYGAYKKYEFNVPVGTGQVGKLGDALDRYFVRFKEIEESTIIIKQALDSLPDGSYLTNIARILKVPKGEAYVAVESPRGTFGVYISSSGEKYPERIKFRTPSFSVLNIISKLMTDIPLGDVPTILASLDILISEVDR